MNTDNTNSFMIAGFHNKLPSNPGFSFLMSERMIRHVWGEGRRERGGGYGSIGLEPTCTYDCGTAHPPLRTRLPNQDRFPVSLLKPARVDKKENLRRLGRYQTPFAKGLLDGGVCFGSRALVSSCSQSASRFWECG